MIDILKNEKHFDFVPIKPDIFIMGSPLSEKNRYKKMEKQHVVSLTNHFEMSKYVVTNRIYDSIIEPEVISYSDVHKRNISRMYSDVFFEKRTDLDDFPVINIRWQECIQFCKKLSNFDDQYIYRLPTEAEWEYCCRANTTGPLYGPLDDIAWHYGNSSHKIHPVGQKQSNKFGLYDMIGNVCEWCSDVFNKDFSSDRMKINLDGVVINPKGPTKGNQHIFRGGAYDLSADYIRAAFRSCSNDLAGGSYVLGFRLVRTKRV